MLKPKDDLPSKPVIRDATVKPVIVQTEEFDMEMNKLDNLTLINASARFELINANQ